LLDTGLRAMELCSLRIGNVDLKTGQVEIKHGVIGGGAKDRAFSKSTLKPNLATNCANVTNFFVLFVTFVAALEAQRRDRRTLRTP
jgi:integrase